MKIQGEYIMREIAGETVVVPIGESADSNLLIMLNNSGRILWKKLEVGSDLIELAKALTNEYEIDGETAKSDASDFIEYLRLHRVEITE